MHTGLRGQLHQTCRAKSFGQSCSAKTKPALDHNSKSDIIYLLPLPCASVNSTCSLFTGYMPLCLIVNINCIVTDWLGARFKMQTLSAFLDYLPSPNYGPPYDSRKRRETQRHTWCDALSKLLCASSTRNRRAPLKRSMRQEEKKSNERR